jgi:hypothetical protein
MEMTFSFEGRLAVAALNTLQNKGLLPPAREILLQAISSRSNGLGEECTLGALTVGFT